MATGLLNVNPYYKGVNLDFTSKPTQLAIQLQQKEQAKAEALERYYMDYEKSINPKGLGKGEAEVFNKKFNTAREYWMKNKEAILNPRRYGMDAQSTYMAALKDAQGYIELGKQATAERKAFSDFVKKQIAQGKRISDNYLGVMENAMKPVEGGYVAPDISQIKIYDPHDDFSFVDKTWKGIDLPGNIINEKEIIVERGKPKETGRLRPVMQEEITKAVADTYAQRARGYYRSNDGTQEQYNILFQDKDFKKQMNPIFTKYFNRDISSPEDLLVAQGLASKSPKREAKGAFEVPDPTWMEKFNLTQAAINARADQGQGIDAVEQYLSDAKAGKTFAGAEGENIEMVNFPETILKDLGKNKRPAVIGRGIGDGEFYNIVYQKDSKGNVTDLIDWGQTQKIPQSQIRAAVVKHALPSGAKAKIISGKDKGTPSFVNARKFN
jgi:hypothetical protein